MKVYLDLMQNILANGVWQDNRTGVRSVMLPGAMLKFDLREGFPAMTTKTLAFGAVKGELLGFLRGYTSASAFRGVGCKVWDANASAPAWVGGKDNPQPDGDYLGRIYGAQWRKWRTGPINEFSATGEFDQITWLLEQIQTNPTSRRLVVSAWRPDEISQMALPPCHYAFQVIIEQGTQTMHLLWNQRSCDMFLGVPFNIASYALLLSILAKITGYKVGTLTGFLADAHIYEDHLDALQVQLSRTPLPPPTLDLGGVCLNHAVEDILPADITLLNYVSHGKIPARMAV